MSQETWDKRFLEMSELVASWSKDPKKKVGAVLVDKNNRIVSVGFNGFARGTSDALELYNNQQHKLQRILHAETNAIMFSKGNTEGCTLYTSYPTCLHCASQIIQSGIARLVYFGEANETSKWVDSANKANEMYQQSGVIVHEYW